MPTCPAIRAVGWLHLLPQSLATHRHPLPISKARAWKLHGGCHSEAIASAPRPCLSSLAASLPPPATRHPPPTIALRVFTTSRHHPRGNGSAVHSSSLESTVRHSPLVTNLQQPILRLHDGRVKPPLQYTRFHPIIPLRCLSINGTLHPLTSQTTLFSGPHRHIHFHSWNCSLTANPALFPPDRRRPTPTPVRKPPPGTHLTPATAPSDSELLVLSSCSSHLFPRHSTLSPSSLLISLPHPSSDTHILLLTVTVVASPIQDCMSWCSLSNVLTILFRPGRVRLLVVAQCVQ